MSEPTASPTGVPVLEDPPAPVVPEPEFDWFWCDQCYLVTERPGACPSCSKPVAAVTGSALPYGPYKPRSTRRRRRRLAAGPLVAVGLVTVAAVIGGLLFRAGDPLGGAAPGSGGGNPNAVHTPVTVPVLGPMSLPGQWLADASVATDLKQSFAANHGIVALALSDGSTSLGIVTIPPAAPSPTPAPELKVGDTQTGTDGTKFTVTSLTLLTIDGFQAERRDVSITRPSGARGIQRTYFIIVPNETILIQVVSPAAPNLVPIEAALLAYPGSVGPQA